MNFSLSSVEWIAISGATFFAFLTRRLLAVYIIKQLPNNAFEFASWVLFTLPQDLLNRIRPILFASLFLTPFWYLALKLLSISHALELTIFFALFVLIPHVGLWLGFLAAVLFIQQNMAYFQIVGLTVSIASIWLLKHVFFQKILQKAAEPVKLSLVIGCCIAGYLVARITGMFLLPSAMILGTLAAEKMPHHCPEVESIKQQT
ncbi:hypothetical protein JW935_27285 [candidate division KSB1 bacterium]|nr:hypothetical protein [candidate division KSB1 bacterium]